MCSYIEKKGLVYLSKRSILTILKLNSQMSTMNLRQMLYIMTAKRGHKTDFYSGGAAQQFSLEFFEAMSVESSLQRCRSTCSKSKNPSICKPNLVCQVMAPIFTLRKQGV